ncbi:pilus assembly protein PilV [Alteromonas gracilis]|uniref:pilus assembly protein PilV n=1 Tax=Alteromonas gracilis TaxID=1479524 RepID=UPI003736B1A8
MKCEKVIMKRPTGCTIRAQHGAGLIEILITLFILAVGLLGVAALQFTGSFANKDAISRTQAEMVAAQVAERLRAAARPATVGDGMVVNNAYFSNDTYNFSTLSCTGSSHPYQCFCLARPAGIPNCEGQACNEAQMARYDGWALSCSAVQTNPQTEVSVSCDDNNINDIYSCSAGSRVEVLLSWPVASSGNQSYTLNTRCNPDEGDSNACVFKDITL